MTALRMFLIMVCSAVPGVAIAHGGGLDGHGCHHNRKAGGYHCHRGPLAGQSFASREEMLAQLRKKEPRPKADKKSSKTEPKK